jgi:murein DD-endopeptidase MepM/ murein hydrolase activator NlpD
VVFRKYVIKKDDNFFSIMAKTMLDHDTLSSINFLASLWDIHPGSTWLVPNARGIAAEGSIEDIVKKYKIDQKYIFPIPGKDNYYFVVNRSFDPLERDFLNGTVFIKPVGGVISSKYGVRVDPFTNKNKFHRGIDIACTKGSTVRAAASGKVVYTGVMGGYGNLVIIEHENGYQTMYGHLKSIMVKGNNLVKQGDQIGLSGDTGKVTGPHLHFEVKRKGKNIHPKVKDYSMH